MKGVLRIGTVGEEQFVVSEQHLIDFAHDGMPQILCTPWLIWFLEHAARSAVLPLLEPGESTVGVVINVKHTAATPPTDVVLWRMRESCTSRGDRQTEAARAPPRTDAGRQRRAVHGLRLGLPR